MGCVCVCPIWLALVPSPSAAWRGFHPQANQPFCSRGQRTDGQGEGTQAAGIGLGLGLTSYASPALTDLWGPGEAGAGAGVTSKGRLVGPEERGSYPILRNC